MNIADLKDKRILVTGASRGLGSVCARALAGHEARLVLTARSEQDLKKVLQACRDPERHSLIASDLTDMKNLGDVVQKARGFLGEIDVVLHVVGGGIGFRDPLLNPEQFMQLFTLNVLVAAEINRLIVPDMIRRKSGILVHVGSIASTEATGSVGYNTVKAALAAYVRSIGREVAGSGVVATGILPGGFYAPGNSWRRLEARNPEAVNDFIKKRLPRGFLGNADELVAMILFLCSGGCSMMQGCLVPIDAGEGMTYIGNE